MLCRGESIIGDGSFQTCIKVDHLYVQPPKREEAARKIITFQQHALLKKSKSRLAFNKYMHRMMFSMLPKFEIFRTWLLLIRLTRNEGLPLQELQLIMMQFDEPNIAVLRELMTVVPPLVNEKSVR